MLGSLWTTPALRPWYASLSKPRWTPPNWLFGPVWTILYVLMAIAAWLVWKKVGLTAVPMQLFLLQLTLNVATISLKAGPGDRSRKKTADHVVRHPGGHDRILESSSGRRLVTRTLFDLG